MATGSGCNKLYTSSHKKDSQDVLPLLRVLRGAAEAESVHCEKK